MLLSWREPLLLPPSAPEHEARAGGDGGRSEHQKVEQETKHEDGMRKMMMTTMLVYGRMRGRKRSKEKGEERRLEEVH